MFAPHFFAYANAPIKILLVPGHDNKVWGAQYGSLKEADMNLTLATQLFNILNKDNRFQVFITRDKSGYTKEFADYFAKHQLEIATFKLNAKQAMKDKIAQGAFIKKSGAPHHSISEIISLKLYGITKWADENKIDAIIHIHFNDYPRKKKLTIGKYRGFTIYVPDKQMANAKASTILAKSIFAELHKKYSTSTFKQEKGGLIPDQKLIALGANDTLMSTVRSVLIEYGYIYEKKFRTSSTRQEAYKTMAELTAKGVTKYFYPSQPSP